MTPRHEAPAIFDKGRTFSTKEGLFRFWTVQRLVQFARPREIQVPLPIETKA
jgi:hypothetical protein